MAARWRLLFVLSAFPALLGGGRQERKNISYLPPAWSNPDTCWCLIGGHYFWMNEMRKKTSTPFWFQFPSPFAVKVTIKNHIICLVSVYPPADPGATNGIRGLRGESVDWGLAQWWASVSTGSRFI